MYQEPIRKTIKKCYSISIEGWINDFFETIAADFPFMSEFLDPLIHEPLKDFIVGKTEKIARFSFEGNVFALKKEMQSVYENAKGFFSSLIPAKSKFHQLQNTLRERLYKIANVKAIIIPEIEKLRLSALTNYSKINWHTQYELLRNEFYFNLENDLYPLLTGYKKQIAMDAFDSWYEYLENNKLQLGLDNFNSIEEVFINYCKTNPAMTACWGYIVLSGQLENIERRFPGSPNLRPYEGCVYYFEQFGYTENSVMEHFYTNQCDKYVGDLCPK